MGKSHNALILGVIIGAIGYHLYLQMQSKKGR